MLVVGLLLSLTPMPVRSNAVRLALLVVSLGATVACSGNDTPTSPTATTTTTTTTSSTPAEAKVFETFTGSLPIGGARFYSFEVPVNGTVTLTLDRVGGGPGGSAVPVGMGLGVPDGTDCLTSLSLDTEPGEGPHISTTRNAGIYCARVSDIGNLTATAPFTVTIGHP